jgi:hypothetical protein
MRGDGRRGQQRTCEPKKTIIVLPELFIFEMKSELSPLIALCAFSSKAAVAAYFSPKNIFLINM